MSFPTHQKKKNEKEKQPGPGATKQTLFRCSWGNDS